MGRIPDFIKSSMGGFLSLESSFLQKEETSVRSSAMAKILFGGKVVVSHLAACTALSWTTGLLLLAFCKNQEAKLGWRGELPESLPCSREVASHLNNCFERVILLQRERTVIQQLHFIDAEGTKLH